MNNFKRVFVVIALVLALSVGVLTTAFANEEVNEPEIEESESSTSTGMDPVLADRLAAIEANTPLKQYDLPVIVGPLTWEDGNPEVNGWTKSGTSTKTPWGQILSDVGVNDMCIEHDENGNAYFTMRYNGADEKAWETSNGTSLHTYPIINVDKRTQKNNLVMEFDITSFSGVYPGMGIEHSTVSADNGGRAQPRILEIKTDGSIQPSYGINGNCQSGYKISAEEKAKVESIKLGVNGEWTHISLIYESDTCFVTLYVNYEYICRYDTRPKGVSHYDLTIFRTGTDNSTCIQAEASIDNFIAYEGSYLRTVDLFDNMTDPDRFMFYSGYSANTEAPYADRIVAYREAQALLDKYYENGEFIPADVDGMTDEELAAYNEKLEAAVNSYNAFISDGYDSLYTTYIAANLVKFGELVNEFEATQVRTLDSIDARKMALNSINTFLTDCGADILQSEDSDYISIKSRYDAISTALTNDTAIINFCNAVDRFYAASKFGADVMQKHYNTASEILMTVVDRAVMNAEGFERFKESYALYESGADLLAEKIRDKNAKTIIDCISFIDEYTSIETWEANYDYINRYVVIVRKVVKENNYNTEMAGVKDALEFFYLVDDYFYGLLQQEHAAYIGEMLDKYLLATGYVEKVGICAHLRAYIASADISFEHELIKDKVTALGIYESELEQYKDDYNDVLTQNTVIFKNTVNLMATANGYAELLALYNKAQELYFAMNVGDENIEAELAIYDAMTFRLAEMERASEEFLVAAELLRNAATKEERYAALVSCYIAAVNADMDYEGVGEAMEYYLAEYAAYNNSANAIISEITALNNVAVGSVRANCGVNEIIAVVIKKITDAD